MKQQNQSAVFPEGKTALVTIDIQRDYFWGGAFPLWRAGRALRRTQKLLAWARERGLPILHVRHGNDRPGARFLLAGTPGADLHPGLEPRPGEAIVDKRYPNSFRETGLEAYLRGAGVETVLWAGMMTWMCVDTTVRAAKDLGFANVLAGDATASGWLLDAPGSLPLPVLPWRTQRSFLAALGAWHARVLPVRRIVRS